VAAADSYSTAEDTSLTVAVAAGLLDNDSDIDSGAADGGESHRSEPRHPEPERQRQLHLHPERNFNGLDSFTYKANDGTADSSTVNRGPERHPGQRCAARCQRQRHGDGGGWGEQLDPRDECDGNVLSNDSDVDTRALRSLVVSALRTGAEAGSGTAGTVARRWPAATGTLTLQAGGGYVYVVDNTTRR